MRGGARQDPEACRPRAPRRWRRRRSPPSTGAREHLGPPNAIWRPLRQSTRSKPRAWSTSCVAISTPRPSAASRSMSCASTSALAASTPVNGSSSSSEAGVLHERAGDQHALALPARELAERPPGEVVEIDAASASSARERSLRPGRRHHGKRESEPMMRHVERGDRVVEPRALGLRHDAAAGRAARARPRAASARPAARGTSVDLPPPFGPSTPARSPGSMPNVRPSSTGRPP